jgi:hypothetical protein
LKKEAKTVDLLASEMVVELVGMKDILKVVCSAVKMVKEMDDD